MHSTTGSINSFCKTTLAQEGKAERRCSYSRSLIEETERDLSTLLDDQQIRKGTRNGKK